ncbi:MAG: Glycerophosphoryl diester phosphodiesterase family [Candidatus Parcubacteria bacterium]|jgi:glycerophosphoryl diester phosphodiesterase
MKIITHRGLDSEHHHTFTESSKEAFAFFLGKGWGLEFDVRITNDGVPVISHDASLGRLTNKEEPAITEMTADEFLNTPLPNGSTLTFDELITMMRSYASTTKSIHALHLKHHNQTSGELELLLPYLAKLVDLPIIIFDVTPSVARLIKESIPSLQLSASVAHPYDILRHNSAVGETLLSLEELEQNRDVYDWAWLDEWDRTDAEKAEKALYTKETVIKLQTLAIKSVVVSPELHATSPKLLGGESHQDAVNIDSLGARWQEIAKLQADAICTDYPHKVSSMVYAD